MTEHPWGNWRYLLLNGRIRSKGIAQPRRERVLVRAALAKLRLRYREIVPILNPDYGGWKGKTDRAVQWLDFCVWTGERMIVLLFVVRRGGSGPKPYERAGFEAKKRLLEKRGIPYLILSRKATSQIYEVQIKNFIIREERIDNELGIPSRSDI